MQVTLKNTPEYRRLTRKSKIGSKNGDSLPKGLFQSEEEIANSATMPDRPAYPGYIKYMDRNGDGIITVNQDQGYVGKKLKTDPHRFFQFIR